MSCNGFSKASATSFGIGILELDTNEISSSTIVFPAKNRNNLDWRTMNKLANQNPNFAQFIADVRISFNSKKIYKEVYDPIPIPEKLKKLL